MGVGEAEAVAELAPEEALDGAVAVTEALAEGAVFHLHTLSALGPPHISPGAPEHGILHWSEPPIVDPFSSTSPQKHSLEYSTPERAKPRDEQ